MDLDAASKARLKLLYPDFTVRVMRVLEDMERLTNWKMKIGEGVRLWSRQADLYAQGRTKPGPGATPEHPLGHIVTNNKAGESLHHYGCAVDCIFPGQDPYLEHMTDRKRAELLWATFGRVAQAHGLEWGGSWKKPVDKPHIQLRYGGLSNQEVRELFLAGERSGEHGFEAVWARFDEIRQAKTVDKQRLARLGKLFELPTAFT
jgi:peptidoglycan L-alanyl-D-glutamate endopeptidase CwlK